MTSRFQPSEQVYEKSLLQNKFRNARFANFIQRIGIRPTSRILDVGGSAYTWEHSGLERQVTILNIKLPPDRSAPYQWVEGSACKMDMFSTKSFDIVFSNSVIEHVGPFDRQKEMADEIRRVGKKYWVQTPNKHFPIEIHFLFPFFQYLPRELKKAVARSWPFSFAKRLKLDPIEEAMHIWPLGMRKFRMLFPEANILTEKVFHFTKSLIAFYAGTDGLR